ncbi:hypothetical protein ESCO_006719 [Escovopsis weberi]|uniref:magnesium chelatase n=1 Tax=Escovopsis weberi TaxID=150374 RepID=A0A0M9VVS1_ESCWE|nr:hypothetical protein ESCO_006719 [Escovopsis weberi]
MAADDSLLEKVHDLSDLELAVLLCLINREHVLISTPSHAVRDLVLELQLLARRTFGLRPVIIDCDPNTTLEDFASALVSGQQHHHHHHHHHHPHPPPPEQQQQQQQQQQQLRPPTAGGSRADSRLTFTSHSGSFRPSLPGPPTSSLGSPAAAPAAAAASPLQIANLVVARNLDRAPRIVQIQALELLRTRRVFTRTAVHAAPKQFVFVPVLASPSGGRARVTGHLNDFFAIAHWHDPRDGFINLEESRGGGGGDGDDDEDDDDIYAEDETSSTGSVVKRESPALISETDISHLAQLGHAVRVDVDILRYQMNVISFLRMHRAVAGGISPAATKHLHQLVRSLAPLHRLDHVTPALVGLAVRKTYLHRIRIAEPEAERSMQWGSSIDAVRAVLDGVGPEKVMDEVLRMVTAPV